MSNKITAVYHPDGCFNVDADHFTLALIEGMYFTCDGVGMQVNTGITPDQEKQILDRCLKIHRLMREIQGIQEKHT